MGSFQGALASAKATDLGAIAVKAALLRAGEAVEGIYMGCVLPGGLGQAPARQAALGAGLPSSVQATTVNKMCGSGELSRKNQDEYAIASLTRANAIHSGAFAAEVVPVEVTTRVAYRPCR